MASLQEDPCLLSVALGQIKGLGGGGLKRLVDHFGDPRRAFRATLRELERVPGLGKGAAQAVAGFADWEGVRREVERAEQTGARIVPFDAAEYPALLREISDPPAFLYVKGEITAADRNAVAVVGSRSASTYGVSMARELCLGLGRLGFTVVSGLARGIDAASHEAALEAGGRTLAVLGCGVDIIYPPEHEPLYRAVQQSGAVLSDLPLGTPPFSYNFPARNRLISGLCVGVVVVEATEKSGSLITAQLGLEQGREVFAVPGHAGASRSRGTHRLIRQGAKLVEGVEDIVEEIAPQLIKDGHRLESPRLLIPPGLSPECRKVFDLVAAHSLQIDEVIEASGLSPAKVSEILLDLEIRGILKQLPGKVFAVR